MTKRTFTAAAGLNRFDLDLSDLKTGVYFVKMKQGDEAVYEKLTVN